MDEKAIVNSIKQNIKKYYANQHDVFVKGKSKIKLQQPTYGADEVNEAIDSFLSSWVTMGKKVEKFESLFANYIGTKYAVMLNSGSSANLVALSVLVNPRFKNQVLPNSEVITPAVTWATTVFPISNVGLTPVLVDVELETFNIDPSQIEKAITKKTRAIMPVHLLGNPASIDLINDIAKKHDLHVIEDCCEAHGSQLNDKNIGSFGDMSTFSFYLSHHISTIEGGMLLTDNPEIFELAKSLRAFGWIRDLKNKKSIAKKYSDIDDRFLFYNTGYNLRPTEIQGSFGIHQMKKLNKFLKIRKANAEYWNKKLEPYSDFFIIHKDRSNSKHAWFAYPIIIRPSAPFKRIDMMNYLEKNLIETRPIQTGDITKQPAMKILKHRVVGDLKNTRIIHNQAFFIGNHQGIGNEERKYVSDTIENFLKKSL